MPPARRRNKTVARRFYVLHKQEKLIDWRNKEAMRLEAKGIDISQINWDKYEALLAQKRREKNRKRKELEKKREQKRLAAEAIHREKQAQRKARREKKERIREWKKINDDYFQMLFTPPEDPEQNKSRPKGREAEKKKNDACEKSGAEVLASLRSLLPVDPDILDSSENRKEEEKVADTLELTDEDAGENTSPILESKEDVNKSQIAKDDAEVGNGVASSPEVSCQQNGKDEKDTDVASSPRDDSAERAGKSPPEAGEETGETPECVNTESSMETKSTAGSRSSEEVQPGTCQAEEKGLCNNKMSKKAKESGNSFQSSSKDGLIIQNEDASGYGLVIQDAFSCSTISMEEFEKGGEEENKEKSSEEIVIESSESDDDLVVLSVKKGTRKRVVRRVIRRVAGSGSTRLPRQLPPGCVQLTPGMQQVQPGYGPSAGGQRNSNGMVRPTMLIRNVGATASSDRFQGNIQQPLQQPATGKKTNARSRNPQQASRRPVPRTLGTVVINTGVALDKRRSAADEVWKVDATGTGITLQEATHVLSDSD